jgi:hypothetical protein
LRSHPLLTGSFSSFFSFKKKEKVEFAGGAVGIGSPSTKCQMSKKKKNIYIYMNIREHFDINFLGLRS